MSQELAPNGKPKVIVPLLGEDGNAFFIMGRVDGAMRRAGWTDEERKAYRDDAMSGNYDHLLQVTMRYSQEPGDVDDDDDNDDGFGNDALGDDGNWSQ